MARGPKPDRTWEPAFLVTLRNAGNVRAACEAAGVDRKTAYAHRKRYAEFAHAWTDAMEDALDVLEAAAIQRARTTSDTLLIFLLKAHRPEIYRERITIDHRTLREVAESVGATYDEVLAEAQAILKGK